MNAINKNINTIQPKKIISLVPSITELLFNLGLGNKIVGITNYCKYPEKQIINIKKIGGTKTINLNTISELNPDLIIAIKEENKKEDVIKLTKNYKVFIGNLTSYNSALKLIKEIGTVCLKEKEANQLILDIENKFNKLKNKTTKTCCYLIWNNPIMTIGGKTFISSMLKKAGFHNVFSNFESYPKITEINIKKQNPEYIFLSSEPFKFTEKHRIYYQKKFPNSKVILVDGEMFSWYGSRMLLAPNYFNKLQ